MRHHAIVITGYNRDKVEVIRDEIIALAGRDMTSMVSPTLYSPLNGYATLCIAPDGSKEGWPDSDHGDTFRQQIVALLTSYRYEDGSSPVAWAEVQYGDDEKVTRIVRHSDEDGELE